MYGWQQRCKGRRSFCRMPSVLATAFMRAIVLVDYAETAMP
jgi:hypothetical protein